MKGLRKKLKENKITMIKLSKDLGIGYQNLSRIINSKQEPNLSTIIKIMDYFNDHNMKNYL